MSAVPLCENHPHVENCTRIYPMFYFPSPTGTARSRGIFRHARVVVFCASNQSVFRDLDRSIFVFRMGTAQFRSTPLG